VSRVRTTDRRGTGRLLERLVPLLAVVAGSLPGLVLPFMLVDQLPKRGADDFFLIASTSLVLVNIIAATWESAVVAEAGRFFLVFDRVPSASLRRLQRHILRVAAPATFVLVPGLTGLYGLQGGGSARATTLLSHCLILLPVPILAAQAATYSGLCISRGRLAVPLLSIGFRSLLALLTAVLSPRLSTILAAYLVGEVLRVLTLRRASRDLISPDGDREGLIPPSYKGLLGQAAAMGTLQMYPVVDRLFLARSPAGAVAAYELCDKIFFALNTVLLSTVVLPTVSKWPVLIGQPVARVRRAIARDLSVVTVTSAVGAALVIIGLALGRGAILDIVPGAADGLSWARIALLSLPFAALDLIVARIYILARRTASLPMIAGLGLLSNIVADVVLYNLLGAVGIIWATVVMRLLLLLMYASQRRSLLDDLAAPRTQ
jgi:hypothetical protein